MKLSFDPEVVALKTLTLLKDEGWLLHIIKAKKNGELDKEGIDFLCLLPNGLWLALQVTGNPATIRRHQERHPFVYHVLVINRNRPYFIKKKVERIIMGFYH